MKIESIKIENFRSFKEETIFFDDYTCFVGANGCGKPTILNALNIFFRQDKDCTTDLSKLSVEDFHHKNVSDPLFIPCDNFESIRVVREKGVPSASYISQLSYSYLSKELKSAGQKALKEEGVLAKLYPSLNPIINEMFFCNKLILTEGIEDVAYISTYLLLTEGMKDFRRYGGHIVPVGGKSEIIKPLATAKLLNIPVYVVCDADTDKDDIADEAKRKSEVASHKKDNKSILSLLGIRIVNPKH